MRRLAPACLVLVVGCGDAMPTPVRRVEPPAPLVSASASAPVVRFAEEEQERPRLFLSVGRGTFASGRDVELGGAIDAPPQSIVVESSVVTITNRATGKVRVEARDAFLLKSGARTGGLTSSGGPELPVDLEEGDYRVVWRVNELASNALAIRIDHAFDVTRAVPLTISWLERADGRRDPTRILVQLTNVGASPIGLPSALAQATLIADGVEHPRAATLLWGGSSTLSPRRSWGTIEDVADYGVPRGARRLAMRMAGATSAPIERDRQ